MTTQNQMLYREAIYKVAREIETRFANEAAQARRDAVTRGPATVTLPKKSFLKRIFSK